MAAYSTANDPIIQRYIELLQTNPALAQQIDERTAELFGQPELNVYNRGLRNVVTPEGGGADAAYREVPRATALRTAVQELDVPEGASTPQDNFLALDRAHGQAGQRQEAQQLLDRSPAVKAAAPTTPDTSQAPPTTLAEATQRGVSLAEIGKLVRSGQIKSRHQLNEEAAGQFAEQGPPASAATPAGGYRGQMITPVGGAAQPAAEALPDLTTAPEDESFVPLLQRLAPSLYRSATDDMTGTIYPTVDSGTSVPLPEQRKTSDEDQAGGVPLVGEEEIQREFEKLPYKDYPSELVTQGPRGRWQPPAPDIGALPEGAVEQPDMPETLQTKRPGLLGRLGGMIRDNPEVAAQIAQAAGGLMSNIASGRAEREAGRETEGRVARANLISALTGGRARPQVTAAQADEGGLLSRLGQITTAGGRIASGEMARRKAEGVQERELAAKELNAQSQADYRKAMVGISKRQLDVDSQKNAAKFITDYMKTIQDQAKASRLPIKQIEDVSSQFATLRKLDDLEDFIVGADFSALEMGPLSLDEPSQFIFGKDPRIAEGKIQGLIMEIAESVPGVLTEQDQKRLEKILFTMNDRPSTAVDIADAFRQAKMEGLSAQLDGYEQSGGYDVGYFRGQLDDYTKGRGTEGFISALTQDELDLGYE